MLDDTGIVETEIDYRMSTGLARPNKLDWFDRVGECMAEVQPDIVITSFGGNDFVGLVEDDDGSVVVGDPAGQRGGVGGEYQRRAGAMMDLLGRRVAP